MNVFFGLDLTNTRNTGVAFGALEGAGLIVAILIGLSLTLLAVYDIVNRDMPLLWLPVGLLLGGALGNLADRAREGAVIDFIDPVAWPAFDLADACIVVGVFLLLWVVEGRPKRPHRELTAGADDAGLRLDAFLAARGAFASRAAAQRAIERGEVTVNGAPHPKNHRVARDHPHHRHST